MPQNPNAVCRQQKTITPDQAARLVRSGSRIFYGEFALFPSAFDEALSRVAGDLSDVEITSVCITKPPETVRLFGEEGRIRLSDWHFGGVSRSLCKKKLCTYIPLTYHEAPRIIRKYQEYDFAVISAAPMGPRGNFNYGLSNSMTSGVLDKAKTIIVEVNRDIPYCLGGNQEMIHISRVDHVIDGNGAPLVELLPKKPSETDRKIAAHIMPEIVDGACLQLGIGGLPNAVGMAIAESGLKDIGVHTEMMVDAFATLQDKGIVTGARKNIDRYKIAYTFGLGSGSMYRFLHKNPSCASYPVSYINDPRVIALNERVVAINNALEVDLLSQVASESSHYRQISGTGGQLDFIFGAFHSRGGKGIIALSSTYTDADGTLHSRIVPGLRPGTVVTVPRSIVHYVATEHGIVQLKGKNTRQRAEALISIADPAFQESLRKQADEFGLLHANPKTMK